MKSYLALIVAMLLWAISPIATKEALNSFSPLTLVTLRFTMAVLIMLAIGLSTKSLVKMRKKDVPLFLLGGFMQPLLYYVLESYSLRLLHSPTIAEALLSTSPILTPIFAWFFLGERFTWNKIVGILISTTGMLMIVLNFGGKNGEIGSPWGVLLAMLAVFASISSVIVLNKIPKYYNPLSIVFYLQTAGVLFFYPFWALIDGGKIAEMQPSWHGFSMVVYLAIFASVTAYFLFCFAVRKIGATRANAFNNMRPVCTALIMLIFFGETLPVIKWAGIFVVIFGLFVCQSQSVFLKTKKNTSQANAK